MSEDSISGGEAALDVVSLLILIVEIGLGKIWVAYVLARSFAVLVCLYVGLLGDSKRQSILDGFRQLGGHWRHDVGLIWVA